MSHTEEKTAATLEFKPSQASSEHTADNFHPAVKGKTPALTLHTRMWPKKENSRKFKPAVNSEAAIFLKATVHQKKNENSVFIHSTPCQWKVG